MHPYLEIGNLKLQLYYPMFFIGFAAALLISYALREKFGINKKDIFGAGFFGLIGLYIGAKLFYFFTKLPEVFGDFTGFKTRLDADFSGTLDYLLGGMVFYGGLLGFLFGMWVYARKNGLTFLKFADIAAPGFPLAHAFGRAGCFLNGCCYGMEYHGPLAVHYPADALDKELGAVPRFPVQLLEAGLNIICFAVLMYLVFKLYPEQNRSDSSQTGRPYGRLLGIYLSYYIIVRFILEFFRGDKIRGMIGVLSTSQVISLLLIPAAVWLLFRKKDTA